ncbi:MAG: exodeoxyribonuclease VII large subunit [Hyphomicrobiales bacterium]|nr:exodeoxyribonuclease VII large subunit [Hyphomicrobiales bacterium]MDE2113490.1 exodeoxyribonuclease VII large subunit [Hyphomicrobiales bacterium]
MENDILPPQDLATSNLPEQSVSELSGALKRTIEDNFDRVRVRGEVSGYRGPHSSGHVYFALKDPKAKIDAIIWKGVFGKLRTRPQEGLEVVATGKITTFPGKSSYQIIIESIELAGAGALMALLEERRQKFITEGLFSEARKQLIPFLPVVIGVVTSPTGSVIRDIIHRISERFPRRVLVWPVRVQGDTCAAEVAAAIEGFNALPRGGTIPRPDVIIVARGGGSLEDLWGFNEEVAVRAAANSDIPLISAIGHETDNSLLDYVADLRAPTPTAAAEKAVPVRSKLLQDLSSLDTRKYSSFTQLQQRRRTELRGMSRNLPRADDLLASRRQTLDRATERLQSSLLAGMGQKRLRLAGLSHRLASQSPQARMARVSQQLEGLGQRLTQALQVSHLRRRERLANSGQKLRTALLATSHMARERNKTAKRRVQDVMQRMMRVVMVQRQAKAQSLAATAKLLATLDYHQVLTRGFALVRDSDGHMVQSASSLAPGAKIRIQFAHDEVDARVEAKAGVPRKPVPRDQGQLF